MFNGQGLDGEATEPMIKELEEDREESQDPEVEFAIAGAVREYDGLEILLCMIQVCGFISLLLVMTPQYFLFTCINFKVLKGTTIFKKGYLFML